MGGFYNNNKTNIYITLDCYKNKPDQATISYEDNCAVGENLKYKVTDRGITVFFNKAAHQSDKRIENKIGGFMMV